MILIGVLLIVIAVGATVFALMAPSGAAQTIEVTALGFKVSASPQAMFFTGVAAVILLSLGFVMVSRGTRRKASTRKELHQLRKEQAAAGANAPTAEGESRSRRDRPRRGSSADTGGTETRTDTGGTETRTDTGGTETRTDTGGTETRTDTGGTETSGDSPR
jgi:membrane protein implicated in regulation of membrane protease activity